MRRSHGVAGLLVLASVGWAGAVCAADWTNAGGNPGRNGLSLESGPGAAMEIWSGGPSSIIAWQPVTSANRVFLVRQTAFVPDQVPDDSPIYCLDIDTGAVLWQKSLPYNAGDWTAWVAGTSAGQVYASRSGNGASVSAKLYALDEATGSVVWTSAETITAGAYDGVVFASNGDPVVASFTDVKRISAVDGTTVWATPRTCSVSGNCGGAIPGDALYVADAVPGGHAIVRIDLKTGSVSYQGPVMPGFTLQNSPMAGPGGAVYLARTQNNAATDFFYAFQDTGSALQQAWKVPSGWSTSSELAVGVDGGVYIFGPGAVIQRLDPTNGDVVATSMPIGSGGSVRLATDAEGRVFASDGVFPNGVLYAFDACLSLLWSVDVPNINIGAPCLGQSGTMIVAGIGSDVVAYRSDSMAGEGGGTCTSGQGGAGGAAGAGGMSGNGGAGGSGGIGGTPPAVGGTGGHGGVGDATSGDASGGDAETSDEDSGCGCRLTGAPAVDGLWMLAPLVGLIGRRRRKR